MKIYNTLTTQKKQILIEYVSVDGKEQKIIQLLCAHYQTLFNMAEKVLRLAHNILPLDRQIPQSSVSASVRRVLLALDSQGIMLFRSILLLCKAGHGTEALILHRSLWEVMMYLFYIAEKDHDERLNHYRYSVALSDKVEIDDFISVHPEAGDKLNNAFYDEHYNDALQYFRKKHGQNISTKDIREKYALKITNIAEHIENGIFANQRKTFYRYASRVAHGQNILHYIKPTSQQRKFLLRVIPDNKNVEYALSGAMTMIFLISETINKLLRIGLEEEISNLSNELIKILKLNAKNN